MEYKLPERLLAKAVRVLVVGAGGTGSHVLTGLAQLDAAMIALGHPEGLDVTVVDSDTVSMANVGRQMFFPSDVGKYKAEVLVNRLNIAMGVHWKACNERLTDRARLDFDLIIGCVDNREARAAIVNAEKGRRTLWLDLGNKQHDGQVILGELPASHGEMLQSPRLPHAADLFPEIIDPSLDGTDDTPSCSLAEALEKQSLFINRGVALYALNLLSDLFRYGKISYHGVFLNMKTGRSSPLPVDPEVWARFGYEPTEKVADKKAA